MFYLLAVMIALLSTIIFWQLRRSLAHKKQIEILECNLERSRNTLEAYEQQ